MAGNYGISVIIPCFNHGEFLPEAVASVLGLKRSELELIVVDDGSTDQRTRIETELLCSQKIKVLRQENKGLAGARNAGILASRGEYILPLDADDRLRTGWIDRAVEILGSSPKVGVVYGDAECFGVHTIRWKTGPFDRSRLLEANYIHATALYRRSVWEQNGGYDGTMPVQGLEDWDFWIGAVERGWQFVYLPEIFFEYRRATESMATHALGFVKPSEDFVARKHGCMYREAWLSTNKSLLLLKRERESVKLTTRRLRHLLGLRFKRNLSAAGLLAKGGDEVSER